MTRVLFVCLGNICRSPAAEAVFSALAGPKIQTDSAGTSDWHVGHAPYAAMIKAAQIRGIRMSHLRARQFTAADFDDFDLIIAMDRANLSDIETQRPAGNTTRAALFLDFCDSPTSEVPDPYYTRDFDGALDLIETASRGLLAKIS